MREKESFSALRARTRRQEAESDYRSAAACYEDLARRDPGNPRWHLKVGEVRQRLGDMTAVIQAFQRAAEAHVARGDLLRAIAMNRIILDIEPAHRETQGRIAEIYLRRRGGVKSPGHSAGEGLSSRSPAVHKMVSGGEKLEVLELHRLLPSQECPEAGKGGVCRVPLDAPPDDMDAGHGFVEDAGSARQSRIPLFSSLDRSQFGDFIERVKVATFSTGERIVQEGDVGSNLFVLVQGKALALHEGPPRIELSALGEGDFFGEIALIADQKRTATVLARTECTLLVISRRVIADMIGNHPEILKVLLRFFRDRLLNSLVATHPLFTSLAGRDRRRLLGRFAFIEARTGSVLIREGEAADGLYILVSGEIEILRRGVCRSTLSAGRVFGEESLITGRPSAVTALVSSKSWLLRMDRRSFRECALSLPGKPEKREHRLFRERVAAMANGDYTEALSVNLL